MYIDPTNSSPWMTELHKRLVRGNAVILYGNISDQFQLNGTYTQLDEFLGKYLMSEKYEVVCRYDSVDGIRLGDDAQMYPMFERISTGQAVTPDSEMGETNSAPEFEQNSPEPSLFERARAKSASAYPEAVDASNQATPPGNRPMELEQALRTFRQLLGQDRTSVGIILEYSDRMVSDPERFSEGERTLMVLLDKAIRGIATTRSGPYAGRRNALIIVANHLSAVPGWLYRENPLIDTIQITKPSKKEREAFIEGFFGNFHEGNSIPEGPARERAKNEFVDLTDGMTAWDLDAIRRASLQERIGVHRTRELIDYFKYGITDDPWKDFDPEKIRRAGDELRKDVIGQDKAVDAVCEMLVSARVGLSFARTSSGGGGKPKGVFFFVGPSGVGKTELAKALTKLIFSDESAFARFDMSEYKEEHSAQKLTGSPPGYVGYDEGGQLTNRMHEKPFSVLLFDEIEKGHPLVMDNFLQILEDGRLTDNKGKTAYFSQSIIIFTSNIGSKDLESLIDAAGETHTDGSPSFAVIENHFSRAVESHFNQEMGRPELFNRMSNSVLVFDVLRPKHVPSIARKFLGMLENTALEEHGLELNFDTHSILEGVSSWMAEDSNLLKGGRRVRSLLEIHLLGPLNRWIFESNPPPGRYTVSMGSNRQLQID